MTNSWFTASVARCWALWIVVFSSLNQSLYPAGAWLNEMGFSAMLNAFYFIDYAVNITAKLVDFSDGGFKLGI